MLTLVLIAAGCSRDNPSAPASAPSTNSGAAALTPETQSRPRDHAVGVGVAAWQSLDASPDQLLGGFGRRHVRPMLSAAATSSVVTASTSSLVRDVAEG